MPGRRSRGKGARGEREWAKVLRDHGWDDAHRGRQYRGGQDSPDIGGSGDYHWEVKRAETFSPYEALDQAARDSGDTVALVAHRRNRKRWIVVGYADDILPLLRGEK